MESAMVTTEGTEEKKLLDVSTDGEVKEISVMTESKQKKKSEIQVSNTKKPFFFYYNLAKRYIKQHDEVALTALGTAIPTVVTIAEILKKNGLALEKKLMISSVGLKNGENDRLVLKPKIEIQLVNADKIKKLATAAAPIEDC